MRRLAFLALAFLSYVGPLQAQRVAVGVSRDTIRVGDPFRAVVRFDLQPGTDILLPDSLPAESDIENAGRMRMRRDSSARGVAVVVSYALTAWRPGRLALPRLVATVKSGNAQHSLTVDLESIDVVSVLPADTTGIKPKPPKDVIGGNRLWWPWLLAALLLLAALALAYWWYRRRRRDSTVEVPPAIMPRERALEELQRIRDLGLVRAGDLKGHYTLVSEVLRRYMESFDGAWSGDLTTEELTRLVHGQHDVAPAIAVLRASDLVKFARGVPKARDADADWQKTYDWIQSFRLEPPLELEAA